MNIMNYFMLVQTGHLTATKEIVKQIKKAGFKGVYLNSNEGVVSDNDIKFIHETGLTIDTYHLPYNKPFNLINSLWADDLSVYETKRILKSRMAFAYKNKIQTVILHASSGYMPPAISKEGISNFNEIIDYGLSLGLKIAIENIKRLDYVETLLERNTNSNVGFCFDIGHANAFTKNLYNYDWEYLSSRVFSIHLHDNNGVDDLHLMPGMGSIDFKYVFKNILQNRNVNISVEVYYKGRENFYKGISSQQFFDLAYKSTTFLNTEKDGNEEKNYKRETDV